MHSGVNANVTFSESNWEETRLYTIVISSYFHPSSGIDMNCPRVPFLSCDFHNCNKKLFVLTSSTRCPVKKLAFHNQKLMKEIEKHYSHFIFNPLT